MAKTISPMLPFHKPGGGTSSTMLAARRLQHHLATGRFFREFNRQRLNLTGGGELDCASPARADKSCAIASSHGRG